MSATETYLQNNTKHAAEFADGDLPAPPAKQIAIVTCMDARLDPGALLGLENGDAHVIRNAGGVVTEDVIRSLTASQCALGTREIMVIQHTQCGMLAPSDEVLEAEIEKATGVRPPFPMETFADLEDSVRRSITRLKSSPTILHKEMVRGLVYEVETGRLREVS